ncbi:MAG: pyridoxamine 5'-phosphate oxidase family protein [Anaerolineales bacterium]|nr:pyridoxamine 5'-phosphate oxidase family protein [Anaerolineales bacterium]
MTVLPEEVSKAWEKREKPVVFTTVDPDGIPNAIYATCVSYYNHEAIIVANNYFNKTMANIQSGSTGSILFITKDNESYQIKGTIEYHEQGPVFEDMKNWNPAQHPGHGAALVRIEEVYKGSQKLV